MRYAFVAVLLTACAPTLNQANEAGGRVNQVGSLGNDRAFSLAEAHCAKFGKVAVVTGRRELHHDTQFECRAR